MRPDPLQPARVVQAAAEGEAGVGRVRDQPARPQQVHRCRDGPRLRVVRVHIEVPRHGVSVAMSAQPGRPHDTSSSRELSTRLAGCGTRLIC